MEKSAGRGHPSSHVAILPPMSKRQRTAGFTQALTGSLQDFIFSGSNNVIFGRITEAFWDKTTSFLLEMPEMDYEIKTVTQLGRIPEGGRDGLRHAEVSRSTRSKALT